MPRPSRNVDQLLLDAGRELLPQTGVRGLSIRQVTEHAGVNLGMFHYHFKTKDAFVRAILDQKYNDMFATLAPVPDREGSSLELLRAAINVLGQWARDNRVLFVRLLGDAFGGEEVAREFLRANMPRHIDIIVSLLKRAQKDGHLKKMPVPHAIAFVIGAVSAPIMLGTAAINGGFAPPEVGAMLEEVVFTNKAISERVDMALTGMATVRKSGAKK